MFILLIIGYDSYLSARLLDAFLHWNRNSFQQLLKLQLLLLKVKAIHQYLNLILCC